MLLKIITNTLKKALFIDDKNMQQVHNIWCSEIKFDLWCNFIVMILTRTGLHIIKLIIVSINCNFILKSRSRGLTKSL